jgi:hypothetical protein
LASSKGLSSSWKALISNSSTNAAENISWNWGTLKDVNGNVVVDGGFQDLWDGSLDGAAAIDENGTAVTGNVMTATTIYGGRNNPTTATDGFCNELTYAYTSYQITYGNVGSLNSSWIYSGTGYCGYWSSYRVYCVEDVDSAATDTTPNTISPPYIVQVAPSSTQSSSAVIIGGMSSGATQTLSVTATGGSPSFKVNGGASVTSASVQNGDSVVFTMDAPATDNDFNKMTITAGTMTSYWRVWTGWDGIGTGIKRVFADYTTSNNGGSQGGMIGLDSSCNTRASSAGLGGTWKVLASGVIENDWAVNHIGYNWSKLQRIDGTDIVMAGNIWSTDSITTSLLAPISQQANGTVFSSNYIKTNTSEYGKSIGSDTSVDACKEWTSTTSSSGIVDGSSGLTSVKWINNGSTALAPGYGGPCSSSGAQIAVYCIEQ